MGKGGSEQRAATSFPGNCRDPRDPGIQFQITHFINVFTAKNARTSLRCNVFLTFSYPSHLKHLLLRAFLEDGLPERLSKVGVLAERGIKKSKTNLITSNRILQVTSVRPNIPYSQMCFISSLDFCRPRPMKEVKKVPLTQPN